MEKAKKSFHKTTYLLKNLYFVQKSNVILNTTHQDVNAVTQKTSSIFPITQLKQETSTSIF